MPHPRPRLTKQQHRRITVSNVDEMQGAAKEMTGEQCCRTRKTLCSEERGPPVLATSVRREPRGGAANGPRLNAPDGLAVSHRQRLRVGSSQGEADFSTTNRVRLTYAARSPLWLIRLALPAFPAGFDLAGFPAARHPISYRAVRSNLVAAIDLFLLVPTVQLPCPWDRSVLSQIRTTTPSQSPLSE
ncbi:hypothetical protein FBZ94_112132 [Bradyrhizobium sacchari]|uniref:Uncharacterized protein n=1 Tax=Bradyrhizobium sacchari TaxID=1399419 RepID=A0A560HWB2_9BRAD|nr:hypothetical protein FBZ94_112132 [Bradyrhizobium sacchari]TWB68523.1 hypothetical protein FBZ95_11181 [Bradyrhizobium sacchari]